MPLDRHRLLSAHQKARADLLAERHQDGHWIGELSTSALSTATAISALSLARDACRQKTPSATELPWNFQRLEGLIQNGTDWLVKHQNMDGGWGDTDRSFSNISTTLLVIAAFHLSGTSHAESEVMKRAKLAAERLGGISALKARYGQDKTFAIPILTNLALAGQVEWQQVDPLPFEFACIPQSWYRLARMPVVSYAIPALVAVGQAKFHHQPPSNPIVRQIRRVAIGKSLRVLDIMQPESGGFLEAIPLTSFVVMSLISAGSPFLPVVHRGIQFITESVREDGSWPIDTNLATWTTSLAINALRDYDDERCTQWLLSCQHQTRHPYTGASPGGWAWTDLSGGVPDVDDTASALLALRRTGKLTNKSDLIQEGLKWLLELQNRDGGWPTFCRGWGNLPFDRSGTDLTAHAMRALHVWSRGLDRNVRRATERGFQFLEKNQQLDGHWVPLWFGNQHHPHKTNPVYGTAKVLLAYSDLDREDHSAAEAGRAWLLANQNADGGWGQQANGGASENTTNNLTSSVEETALALDALLSHSKSEQMQPVINKGLEWLITAVEEDQHRRSSPIGFYFAKLWYYERLYPQIFTVAALTRALSLSAHATVRDGTNKTRIMKPL